MGLFDKFKDKFDGPDDTRKDEVKADFSDVVGSSSSTPADATHSYTVVSGDSLSKIAQREYGEAGKWRRIYDANRDIISDPDLIYPGQVLTIPSESEQQS